MSKMHYFPFYADNWISSRKRVKMSYAQQGIYILLLAHSFFEPLPNDIEDIQKLCPGARRSDIVAVMTSAFRGGVEGGVEGQTNPRLMSIRHKLIERSEKARESAKSRWNKETEDAKAMPTQCDGKAKAMLSKTKAKTKENLTTRGNFVPPSVGEVDAYCKERNNGIDAQTFVSHYAARGWMIGKNKMKDWKQAVITWEQKRKEQKGGDTMAKKSAAEELMYALKNENNKTMPPLSTEAVKLFYSIKTKWTDLQKWVLGGGVIKDDRLVHAEPAPDFKKQAGGDE